MPLVWEEFDSYDIHVLRNGQASVALEKFVAVLFDENVDFDGQPREKVSVLKATSLRAAPAQLGNFESIAFLPSWIEANTPPANNIQEQNGISVDTSTGQITASALPAGTPHTITSFGLRVVMFLNTPAAHTPHPEELHILVHVHNNIANAWVTPALLNVRPDIIKGIFRVILQVLTTAQIKKVKLYKKDDYQELMTEDLLLKTDALDLPGPFITLDSASLLQNRKVFRDNRVFYNPLHLEVLYVASDRFTQFTLPLHLPHLIQANQVIKDEEGNDLFKILGSLERFQYQASLYASFDDGTVGDISNWHGVTWKPGDTVSPNDIRFDQHGEFFKVFKAAEGKTIEIKASLPPGLATAALTTVTGNIKVDPSWLGANLVATPVPQSPIHPETEQPVNILFVSEGFDNATEFSNLARDLCQKLRDDQKTTPWNLLFKSAINAWMLYEKSEEKAASILYESVAFEDIKLLNEEETDLALPLSDLIEMGPKLSNQVTFLNFVSKVGLPVPADVGKSKGAKLNDWRELFSPSIGAGDWAVSDEVFGYWRKLGNKRALTEERNTAFGLSCGAKPALLPRTPTRVVVFNDNARLDYQHINIMLSGVRANSMTGDLIGEKFWGRDKSGKLGKDFGLIVFLVGGLRESGVRLGAHYYPDGQVNQGIAVGLGNDNFVSLKFFSDKLNFPQPFFKWKNATHLPAIDLVPFAAAELSISAFATVAHELGHFFNLRDEYAEAGNLEASPDPELAKIYNLQHHTELLDNDKISGDKIKWRWPRISKAGILAGSPAVGQPVAGNITVTLKSGQGRVFKVNEEVHLRQKNILQFPLDKLSSPKLKVNKIDGDKVTLEPLAPDPFQWNDFGQGALLILRTKASARTEDNPTQDEYAELLSSMMRHQINETHKTMTKEPCVENFEDVQQPGNIPSVLSDPDDRSKIIGLYAGGDEYSCKIYHPSGQCIMRSHKSVVMTKKYNVFKSKKEPVYSTKVYPFCQICRYSLVDQIDASQHDKIDRLYGEDYPGTSRYSRNKALFWLIGIITILVVLGIYVGIKESEND